MGFDAGTNGFCLGAVECTRGKTSWCRRRGRKHRKGYFLPLPYQCAALEA